MLTENAITESDVRYLREQRLGQLRHDADTAFTRAERHIVANEDTKNAVGHVNKVTPDNTILNLGSFQPRPSMATTSESHEYPFLLRMAWEKIQRAEGKPLDRRPDLVPEVEARIKQMLAEEYHHAVPVEAMPGIERCFGVCFTLEDSGEHSFYPFVGFGGQIPLHIFSDIYAIDTASSDSDKEIIEAAQKKQSQL